MNYIDAEADIIIADSFDRFNYRQKKLFLAAQRTESAGESKYFDALIKICGESVYNKAREKFRDASYREKVFKTLQRQGISCVTVKSAPYPENLKNTPVPPLVLYCRGNAELLSGDAFAIVGSRKTSAQAIKECKEIASVLSESFTVVTGVADGADRAAAEGAINSGRLICVLPGGHLNPCSGDLNFLQKVERNALTVSEFPPHIPARKYTFVLRNRIIAGLSKGVLVVSAAEKSGALSTSSYAADYGREVFAFPYSIGVASGVGCNALIKNGASLCTCADDILSAFGIECRKREEISLGEDELAVTRLLREQGELHIETIAGSLGKSLPQTASICSLLEIRGVIVKSGNKYVIV